MDSIICLILVALGLIFERVDILFVAALFSCSGSIYGLRNITIVHNNICELKNDIFENSPEKNQSDVL